jgi:hypothetical protein
MPMAAAVAGLIRDDIAESQRRWWWDGTIWIERSLLFRRLRLVQKNPTCNEWDEADAVRG